MDGSTYLMRVSAAGVGLRCRGELVAIKNWDVSDITNKKGGCTMLYPGNKNVSECIHECS